MSGSSCRLVGGSSDPLRTIDIQDSQRIPQDARKGTPSASARQPRMACPVVLTLLRYYLPGFRFGGPVQSLANLVEALGSEFEFRIITSDRDVLDGAPYPDIAINEWTKVGKAWVRYLPPRNQTFSTWVELFRQTPHDLLYLNSVFDPVFSIRALLARAMPGLSHRSVVLAPRGELSPGAVSLKSWKKKPFLLLAKQARLYRGVVWHASTSDEAGLIRQHFGARAIVFVARNVASQSFQVDVRNNDVASSEPFRIVFLSRISRMKNLAFALRAIAGLHIDARFDIWGTQEDASYWKECEEIVRIVPAQITVSYRGVADRSSVPEILSRYDLFFLPSLGENFGHAIAEALTVGTPVLLSNRTPWRDLEAHGVGWDLPLENGEAAFSRVIEAAADRIKKEKTSWRQLVLDYAAHQLYSGEAVEASRQLFRQAVLGGENKT
jgi:glycosyltransferase involved in cell wall biosynthesis